MTLDELEAQGFPTKSYNPGESPHSSGPPLITSQSTPSNTFIMVGEDGKSFYATFTEDGRIIPLDDWFQGDLP